MVRSAKLFSITALPSLKNVRRCFLRLHIHIRVVRNFDLRSKVTCSKCSVMVASNHSMIGLQ